MYVDVRARCSPVIVAVSIKVGVLRCVLRGGYLLSKQSKRVVIFCQNKVKGWLSSVKTK